MKAYKFSNEIRTIIILAIDDKQAWKLVKRYDDSWSESDYSVEVFGYNGGVLSDYRTPTFFDQEFLNKVRAKVNHD